MASAIRVVGGRKSVEANLAENLTSRNHLLDPMFSARIVKMEEKKSKDAEIDSISEDDDDGIGAESCYGDKVGVNFISN